MKTTVIQVKKRLERLDYQAKQQAIVAEYYSRMMRGLTDSVLLSRYESMRKRTIERHNRIHNNFSKLYFKYYEEVSPLYLGKLERSDN